MKSFIDKEYDKENIYIYAVLAVALVLGVTLRGLFFCWVILRKSIAYHQGILKVNNSNKDMYNIYYNLKLIMIIINIKLIIYIIFITGYFKCSNDLFCQYTYQYYINCFC